MDPIDNIERAACNINYTESYAEEQIIEILKNHPYLDLTSVIHLINWSYPVLKYVLEHSNNFDINKEYEEYNGHTILTHNLIKYDDSLYQVIELLLERGAVIAPDGDGSINYCYDKYKDEYPNLIKLLNKYNVEIKEPGSEYEYE